MKINTTVALITACFIVSLSSTLRAENVPAANEKATLNAAPTPKAPEAVDLTKNSKTPLVVEFALGKSDIQESFNSNINAYAKYLADNPNHKIHVSAYADNTGTATRNLELSKARAEALKAALIAQGVAEDRIVIQDHGTVRSKGANSTVAGQQTNRRAYGMLMPS